MTAEREPTASPEAGRRGWGGTRVVDPVGDEWVVRRRWAPRRLRWRGSGRRAMDVLDGGDLVGMGADLPVVGVVLTAVALLLFAVGAVLFIVPALVFVVELLVVVAIVGIGLVGRVLFGRPWTIEARRLDDDRTYEWKVVGWSESRERIEAIAERLRGTGIPPAEAP